MEIRKPLKWRVDIMRRKAVIILGTVILGILFFMGIMTGVKVVAYRAMEKGENKKALQIFSMGEDSSGAGMSYCAMKDYARAIGEFEKVKDYSGLGMAYCGRKEYDKAIECFEKAKDYSGIGLAYCGKREYVKAGEYFAKANDRRGLGLVSLGERDFEKARGYFKQINDKAGLGLVSLGENKFDEALSIFEKLKDKSGIGMALLGKREYEKAAQYFSRSNDLCGLGHVYCGEKRYDSALEYFSQANDLSGLSLVYCGMNEFDKAYKYAELANDQSAKGLIYCGKKEYDTAIEYFSAAKDLAGLSHAYCGKNDFEQALQYARLANDLSAMGHVYCGMKEFEEAIFCFKQINDLSGLSYAWCGKREYEKARGYAVKANDLSALGYIYCGLKEYDKAIKYFRQAKDYTGLSHAWCGKNDFTRAQRYAVMANDKKALGYAYLKRHNYKIAMKNFKQAKDDSGIAGVYAQQKEYEKALQYAGKAKDLSLMGNIQLGIGNIKEAENYFKQAKDLSGLGYAKLSGERYDEAMRYFQAAKDLAGQGFVYSRKEDYKKAEACFKQAKDYSGLGRIALEKKEFEKAIEYFKRANDYDGLGDVYWQLRDFDKAVTAFKNEGNDIKVVQALREKYGSGMEEALIYAKAKIEKGKFTAPLHIEIGKIYLDQKKYGEAIGEFEKVSGANSGYAAEALMWTGKAYYYDNRYELAETCFKELLEKYPDSMYCVVAEKSLETIKIFKEIEDKKTAKRVDGKKVILTSENRCGPDSLSLLLNSYGIKSSAEEIAELAGTDAEGTTMLGLLKAAKKKGLQLWAMKLRPEQLESYEKQAIVLIKGNHYVVLRSKTKNGVIIWDGNLEKHIGYEEFFKEWEGEILAVKEDGQGELLSLKEVKNIKGGREGGTTKGDPGVLPNGSWHMDMANIGPIIPKAAGKIFPYLFPSLRKQIEATIEALNNGSLWLGGGSCETPTDPISVTGGQLIVPVVDVEVLGRGRRNGMGLKFERTYSSASAYNGPLGYGWQIYFNVVLANITINGDIVQVRLPEGTVYTYHGSGGVYGGPRCDGSELIRTPKKDFIWKRWTSRYGIQSYYFSAIYTYYKYGSSCATRLEYIEDQNGNRISYEYDMYKWIKRISDNSGRYLEFERDSKSGRINAVKGPLGVENRYYYDGNDNLIKVSGPENYKVEYEYNDPNSLHNMTAAVDANGNRTEYEYDAKDRCIKVKDPLGNEAHYEYNFEMGITTVTDVRGRKSVYEFDKEKITRIIDSNGGVTGYSYDSNYMRDGICDVNGNVTSWKNDRYGNSTQITDALGNKVEITYTDDYHRIKTMKCAENRMSYFQYDGKGNLIEKDEPGPEGSRAKTYFKYDQYGNLIETVDAEGKITKNDYDSYGNVTKVTDGEGNLVQYGYDALNRLVSSRYGEQTPTGYEYDGLNRLIKKSYPDGSFAEYRYDNNGNLLNVIDANGNKSEYSYNALNQLNREKNAEGSIVEYEYDAVGNIKKIKRKIAGKDREREIEFDDHYNRKTKIIDEEGKVVEYSYEGTAPLLESEEYSEKMGYDKEGNPVVVEKRIYDAAYRLIEQLDGLNNRTRYGYDQFGNLIWVEDGNGNISRYEYDSACNVKIKQTNALNKFITYSYYRNEQLKSKTNADSRKTSYEYDLSGRLKKVGYADASAVEYKYNQYAKIAQMKGAEGITTYNYNNLGQLIEIDGPEEKDELSYGYDKAGNRLSMSVSEEGKTSYSYDKANHLKSITNAKGETTTFSYDEGGRVIEMGYANGTKTEWQYYDNDQVKEIIIKNSRLEEIAGYDYGYDRFGRLERVEDNHGSVIYYKYDRAGELIEETKVFPYQTMIYDYQYGYDKGGNRIEEKRNGESIKYSYNEGNQLLRRITSRETISYEYDLNGNLVYETSSRNGRKEYGYDNEDRLVNIRGSGVNISYSYSADGKRSGVNENGRQIKYIYDGRAAILEKDSSGTIIAGYTRIPNAPGGIGGMISRRQGEDTTYYHCSHLGNVSRINNAAGTIAASYEYDSFGNIVSQSGSLENEYKYKTKEYDETSGLVYFGVRYYHPQIGRFISPDPLGMAEGTNLYRYCNNDPINLIDPWGLATIRVHAHKHTLTGHGWVVVVHDDGHSETWGNYPGGPSDERDVGRNSDASRLWDITQEQADAVIEAATTPGYNFFNDNCVDRVENSLDAIGVTFPNLDTLGISDPYKLKNWLDFLNYGNGGC